MWKRNRVPGETGSERLEDTTENNRSPNKGLHDRSLCLPPHTLIKAICQLETGSERGAQRCLYDGLVESDGICFPSVQLDSVSSSEGQEGTRDAGVGSTIMDYTTLVASSDRTSCGYPVYLGNNPKLLKNVSSPGVTHPLFPSLRLAVWRISDNVTKQWEFQKKLSTPLQQHQELNRQNIQSFLGSVESPEFGEEKCSFIMSSVQWRSQRR